VVHSDIKNAVIGLYRSCLTVVRPNTLSQGSFHHTIQYESCDTIDTLFTSLSDLETQLSTFKEKYPVYKQQASIILLAQENELDISANSMRKFLELETDMEDAVIALALSSQSVEKNVKVVAEKISLPVQHFERTHKDPDNYLAALAYFVETADSQVDAIRSSRSIYERSSKELTDTEALINGIHGPICILSSMVEVTDNRESPLDISHSSSALLCVRSV
jgi:hypothetical protein